MTLATPTPWTLPQPLQGTEALGPGVDPKALRRGLTTLAGRGDVRALVVFGSRAMGTARPDSDLDLLVIHKEAKIPPEEQIPRWQEVRNALGDVGVPVDLLVYGQEDAAWLSGSRWHVLGHAARHGKVLYVAQ
ncbi:MAG: nucleotidyltransferase domain-containing protein [Cyanobium sp.]